MPKFRKKPDDSVFEAEQFFRSTSSLLNSTKGVCQCEEGSGRGHVHTTHGGQVVNLEDGDWVKPEPDGEHYYPIKPDIFEATYESVE
jgi:hypothetical protein